MCIPYNMDFKITDNTITTIIIRSYIITTVVMGGMYGYIRAKDKGLTWTSHLLKHIIQGMIAGPIIGVSLYIRGAKQLLNEYDAIMDYSKID